MSKKLLNSLLVCLALLLASCITPPSAYPGKECLPANTQVDIGLVTSVVDGDTIRVSIKGQNYTVRYIGMDTPETRQPQAPVEYFGPEADTKNRELVEGKTVALVKDVSETDRYDRLLRYVLVGGLDGPFVNYELVRQGYAVAATFPPDTACAATFLQAERQARDAKLGLWGP